ncbi:hypothetical protein KIPB_001965 [Kipferlia bialata]|uniref:CN hydrolase domain-containing protein n=1 Tax=Kipferlia bialata TaxID=797122 RepID=A0A9K3CRE8_9EUKA|nr:hypothetical protein KIPB_001965 [Kipferlia bialata]|eukprot:g1965.t1
MPSEPRGRGPASLTVQAPVIEPRQAPRPHFSFDDLGIQNLAVASRISVQDKGISNLAPFIDAEALETLDICKNQLRSLEGIENLTRYWELGICYSAVSAPVFQTKYGKIAVPICYERHFPEAWRACALNGAEIVVNPSATINGLSESVWPIEARCAAIANNFFTVAINRVGTEHYTSEFTSADAKPAHKDFGQFYGSSYITAPDGVRTPALSRTMDGILITNVDLNKMSQTRDVWNFWMAHRLHDYGTQYLAFSKDDYKPNLFK